MSVLVADCPRCGAKKITFALRSEVFLRQCYDWQHWYEAFCVCRNCVKSTTFILKQRDIRDESAVKQGLTKLAGSVNQYMEVVSHISLKDECTHQPPEHVPESINAAFREGSTCLAVSCYNAAAAMFRLCSIRTSRLYWC